MRYAHPHFERLCLCTLPPNNKCCRCADTQHQGDCSRAVDMQDRTASSTARCHRGLTTSIKRVRATVAAVHRSCCHTSQYNRAARNLQRVRHTCPHNVKVVTQEAVQTTSWQQVLQLNPAHPPNTTAAIQQSCEPLPSNWTRCHPTSTDATNPVHSLLQCQNPSRPMLMPHAKPRPHAFV